MKSKCTQAFIVAVALLSMGPFTAEANYYSGWSKGKTEIRIHPNNASRVKEWPGGGKWLIFSYCRKNWCHLSDRNLSWGWIKKSHLKNLKICPEAVCGDGNNWRP